MSDKVVGIAIIAVAIIISIAYVWSIFFTEYWVLIVKCTLAVAVVGLLMFIGWLGYLLATSTPPSPPTLVDEDERDE